MDPLSLAVIGGALGLIGLSFVPVDSSGPFRYRKVLTWTDGWVATELLSPSALATATSALDLSDCPAWTAALESGMKSFVLVTQAAGPSDLALLCVFDRMGSSWELNGVYAAGMNRPVRPEQEQHVAELVVHMRRDLGKEVAAKARSISDPRSRYAFLRAVVRRPVLAARVVPDPDFADVVVETVQIVHPERITAMEERRALVGHGEFLSSDLVVVRPLVAAPQYMPVPVR